MSVSIVSFWYYRLLVKTVSVKLPSSLASWLTHQAKGLRRSKSEIVREALEKQRQNSGQSSCLDLMRDVCGSIKGPRDLSTNPKHLKGFGR